MYRRIVGQCARVAQYITIINLTQLYIAIIPDGAALAFNHVIHALVHLIHKWKPRPASDYRLSLS